MVVVHSIVEAERGETGRWLDARGQIGELGNRHELEPRAEEQVELGAEHIRSNAEETGIEAGARRPDAVVAEDH